MCVWGGNVGEGGLLLPKCCGGGGAKVGGKGATGSRMLGVCVWGGGGAWELIANCWGERGEEGGELT